MKITELPNGHKVVTLRTMPEIPECAADQVEQLTKILQELDRLADITPLPELETFITLMLAFYFNK